jgi:predicted transcriptional regulator
MHCVRLGFSYQEIARREQVSRERIRQIVTEAVHDGPGADKADHARLQIARLEPALELAASAIEKGELGGVTALLRVLERLDKYGATTAAIREDYAQIHERLMRKMNIEINKLPPADRALLTPGGKADELEGEDEDEEEDGDNAGTDVEP